MDRRARPRVTARQVNGEVYRRRTLRKERLRISMAAGEIDTRRAEIRYHRNSCHCRLVSFVSFPRPFQIPSLFFFFLITFGSRV